MLLYSTSLNRLEINICFKFKYLYVNESNQYIFILHEVIKTFCFKTSLEFNAVNSDSTKVHLDMAALSAEALEVLVSF